MATQVTEGQELPKREDRPQAAAPTIAPADGPVLATNPAPLPPIPQAPGGDGDDPADFLRANRIHVKDGSLFIDSYLVVHPRELAPENEAQLRKKLRLTYSINNPSFYEAPERTAIALNLGQLVPVSLAAKRAGLVQQVNDFNAQVKHHGQDPVLTRAAEDKRNPMSAILRDTTVAQPTDPAGLELLKNGLGLYLLVRERLTMNGYYDRLDTYVKRSANTEQVLGDLEPKIGVPGRALREAALAGGLDAVGQLLGLDPRYVSDVKQLSDYAATQEFSQNLIEHWHLGRQLLGLNAPLEQKIATGMQAHIDSEIRKLRYKQRGHYDVAAPLKQQEAQVADGLNLLEPIQRKLAYALGYEICYSPEVTADEIAFHKGIYGLHRKSANDLRDIRGTYRVYFSGHGDLEGSMRTLVHEMAHNLWPGQFNPRQAAEIDALATSDQRRFAHLDAILSDPARLDQLVKLFGAYKAGNPQEQQAVLDAAGQLLGVRVDGLFPHLKDPYALRYMVNYAQEVLQVEGDYYNKAGYDSPEERFREVISRFAELKQVRLRGQPELLEFIAPGLNRMWDQYYIPHLENVYRTVLANNTVQEPFSSVPPARRDAAAVAEEAPKIEERPTAAPKEAPVSDLATAETPDTKVQIAGLQMNDRILGAQSALKSLGVQPGI